jgi:integrase
MGRVYLPKFRRDGRIRENKYYVVRIRHGGPGTTFALGTSNRAAAATKARQIDTYFLANGQKAAEEKFKKNFQSVCPLTVGELIAEAQKHLEVRPKTFASYARALRFIGAGIARIESDNSKFDYKKGGHAAWLEKVNAVKVARFTPEAIDKWRSEFLSRAKGNAVKLQQLRTSVNYFCRQAKALFGRKVLKKIKGIDQSPFSEVESASASMRYRSNIDFEKLLAMASTELAGSGKREEFKVFLLAACAGLRRSEIDLLPWQAINFDNNFVRIEATEFFEGKSQLSYEDVHLDPEVARLFRSWYTQPRGRFVVESAVRPRIGASYSHYRCQRVFDSLISWLRKHGINTNSPIHTLRKEYGSYLTKTHGIFVASRALRHSSVQVTEQFYASQKERVSLGLGHLLAKPDNVLEIGTQPKEVASNE